MISGLKRPWGDFCVLYTRSGEEVSEVRFPAFRSSWCPEYAKSYMDDFEEDDPVELPGDEFRKAMYLIGLETENFQKWANDTQAFNEIARTSSAVSRVSETLALHKLPPLKLSVASAIASTGLGKLGFSAERDAALKRKWKREFEQRQANRTSTSDSANRQATAQLPSAANPKDQDDPEAMPNPNMHELAATRIALLKSYTDATGHSNRTIYDLATAAGAHSCHKQKFYEWLSGKLPSTSATAMSLERFLTTRPEFDMLAKRRKRKRK